MKSENQSKAKGNLLFRVLRGVAIAIVIVTVGVIYFNKNQSEINQLSTNNSELKDVLLERDSMVNEYINTFDSIENSLSFVNERRSNLIIETNELNASKREMLIKDIRLMNSMLDESSKKIDELEKKFEKSGIQLQSFRNKIANLNKRIVQQNNQIVDLSLQIEEQNVQLASISRQKDSLQSEVLSFQDTLIQKVEIIKQQDDLITQHVNELNKGFFAYGTIKELVENGVVSKEGGFLGIGKNKILQNNFNENYFTKIDISEDSTFVLNAKKVNIISEHPSSSYKLIEEDGLITKLEIEAPQDFWKISNYVVIEVKL